MNNHMVFFNIGWMQHYQGKSGSDDIHGGGSYVSENKFGHEIFNYAEHQGHLYGYVQPSGYAININKLGAQAQDDWVDDILVVWVSTAPDGGSFIVGWFEHARVFRNHQDAPTGSKRKYGGERLGYYCTADVGNGVLLPPDARTFSVPRGKNGMGQSNVWYADKDELIPFRERVKQYVLGHGEVHSEPKEKDITNGGAGYNHDPFYRQQIERAAVARTTEYYEGLGYTVKSVEKDHVGWDLEARVDNRCLLIEVKGLSGSDVGFDLTPNEYDKMSVKRDVYRICVLTSALTDASQLHIFSYVPDSGQWESQNGKPLKLEQLVGARARV